MINAMPVIFCENINRKIPADPGENLLRALEREGVQVYRWPLGYLQSCLGTVLTLLILLAAVYPFAPTPGLRYGLATVFGLAMLVRFFFNRAFDFSFVE